MNYFTDKELECPETGIVKLHPGFLDHLNELRDAFDKPMVVNSCCRSKKHNENIGGHPRSLHVFDQPFHSTHGCMAIDINTEGWSGTEKARFVYLALKNKWSVGIAKTFIHIDRRVDIKMKQVLYTY